jgi:excisionase family DNA binding protein
MAGMFYSLKEAAEKLNVTEVQVRELAKQGKLREFRDGSNLLFKVDEVGALMPEQGTDEPKDDSTLSKKPKRPKRAKKPEPTEQIEQEPIELEEPKEPFGVAQAEQEAAATPPPAEKPAIAEEIGGTQGEEISLAPETGVPAAKSELTDADTALSGEGVSVLGETDQDYAVTDDTMAETAVAPGTTGTTPEAPLEEVEEDVNLDSFGSGSGLLDLSLQADDTSLGGILDEIYTSEAGEAKEPAAASSEEMAAEAEQMLPEEEIAAPEQAIMAPIIAPAYVEVEPDVQSKTLGMLLFLPLLVLVYTAVVAVAGLKGVMPSILAAVQGVIWYMLIAAFVATGLVVGGTFVLTGNLSLTAKTEKNPKKAKKSKKTDQPPPAPEDAGS